VQAAIESEQAAIERADLWPIRELIDPILRPWRLGAMVFGLGGVLALLVAAAGLFSVLSYSVAQRGHEFGVRMALGARPRNIMGLIMRQALAMAAAGVACGSIVSVYVERWAASLLFETSVREPLLLGGMATVLLFTAASASLLPALRARRADPMRALRAD
jgi:ABC-type antimicrobial peptide transport system permease subunit